MLREQSGEFLDYLEAWQAALPERTLQAILADAGGPEHVGVFCVDVINGFCHAGPLSSPRVCGIIAPIVELFAQAHKVGIRHFVLTHDAHDPNAAEFASYPPHCLRGSEESQIVPEMMALPFATDFQLIPKNSIHSGLGTELNTWLDTHPEVTHRIVVGDCTDLCTYQLAMHLKLRTVAANQHHPVILPVNGVDTFDIPMEVAQALQIPPHPADLLHAVFLYNMAQNGVSVVSRITTP